MRPTSSPRPSGLAAPLPAPAGPAPQQRNPGILAQAIAAALTGPGFGPTYAGVEGPGSAKHADHAEPTKKKE